MTLCGLTTVVILSTSQIEINRRTVAMAEEEEEVNYASVVFKTNNHSPREANEEEGTVYSEVKVRSKTTENTADTNVSAGLLPDKKTTSRGCCYLQVACCLGILCVILLLGILAVYIYKSKITNLSAENQNLTSRNQELKTQKQQLETQNQQLETQRKNLTEQIQNNWNEFNVSRAQWSIEAYCPKENQNRQCKACQKGWTPSESSCYAINDPKDDSGQKTWEEARENCRGKISDLVVKFDQKATEYVNFSWGDLGYWIGLRVEAGNWTWINGTSLQTQDYWIEPPSAEAHCATYIKGTTSKIWRAVKCDEKRRWICEKKALSV